MRPINHTLINISTGLSCLLLLSPIQMLANTIEVNSNSDFPAIRITPDKVTGLSEIYVLHDLTNSSFSYKSNQPDAVKISVFSNLGASFSTPVDNVKIDDKIITVDQLTSDSGYMIQDGNETYFFWFVDYSKHRYNITSLSIDSDSDCESTILKISGIATPIYYYSINGRQEILSREINLTYNNLSFDSNTKQFISTEVTKDLPSITDKITLTSPVLCATDFLLKGDRFLKEWNQYQEIISEIYTPVATQVETDAIQESSGIDDESDSSNKITSQTEWLGGSAPSTISFVAYVSDAVIHNEWQFANDENFEDITYRINQQDFSYTFTNQGTTYVRFIGSNSDGSCESYGEVYTVTIDPSELLIPNAFSPNGDGVNDEWKIAYRSLTDFKCWIFDRQGHELFSFDNPDQGWDGTYNGRPVKSGVYFYVLQATGADGKRYKKSGDINILKSSGGITSSDYE